MPINVTMPALSPTMEEGKITAWLVKEGDHVAAGDVIAEIETDKATMEVEAADEGIVGKILVPDGTDHVKVNAVIGVLLEEGESAGDISASANAAAANSIPGSEPETDNGAGAPLPAPTPSSPAPAERGKRVFASPLARRLAKQAGIDIASISGTGPKGRVVKRDVDAVQSGKVGVKASIAAPPEISLAGGMSGDAVRALYEPGSYTEVANDGMRTVVAERLTGAKQTVPHFYLTLDCRIDALLLARTEINDGAPKDKEGKPAYKLSVNDFVVKAWALALQQVPNANATWAGASILYHKASDIAIAVAVPGGLFTPVVRGAEVKSLREISAEVKDLATRAKSKRLAPHEYSGGASTISNMGMFGIREFAAVINPPHGTILAVGAGGERVFAEGGEIKTGTFMSVTLSCDHRSVDGALGAEALGVFKRLIESPVMMLV